MVNHDTYDHQELAIYFYASTSTPPKGETTTMIIMIIACIP